MKQSAQVLEKRKPVKKLVCLYAHYNAGRKAVKISGDKRPTADRPEPSNKLTEEEQQSDISYL